MADDLLLYKNSNVKITSEVWIRFFYETFLSHTVTVNAGEFTIVSKTEKKLFKQIYFQAVIGDLVTLYALFDCRKKEYMECILKALGRERLYASTQQYLNSRAVRVLNPCRYTEEKSQGSMGSLLLANLLRLFSFNFLWLEYYSDVEKSTASLRKLSILSEPRIPWVIFAFHSIVSALSSLIVCEGWNDRFFTLTGSVFVMPSISAQWQHRGLHCSFFLAWLFFSWIRPIPFYSVTALS